MKKCGYATNWQDAGSAYNSEPNYVAWATGISGSTALSPYTCDCPPPATATATTCGDGAANCTNDDNLFRQALTAGKTWKSYQEDMANNCQESNGSLSTGAYAVKHNPAAFMFGGSDHASCQSYDVGSGSTLLYQSGSPLINDLNNNTLPNLVEITPNMCNDTHDCAVATGDSYLSNLLPLILNSRAYTSGTTAVVVMWDEDTPAPNMVIAPAVKPGSVVSAASHYGCLRAIEEMLGFPLLGAANNASGQDLRTNFHM
jgi:phospholipase C